jgi:putative heme-binding domain-containing protein
MRSSRLLLALLVALLLGAPCLAAEPSAAQRAKDSRIVSTLLRLPGVDLSDKPAAKAALLRYLAAQRGTPKYLEIVEKFQLRETQDELLRLALEHADGTLGVEAARLLVKFDARDLLQATLAGDDADAAETRAMKLLSVLRLLGDSQTNALVEPLLADASRRVAIRSAAVAALGANRAGEQHLLALVEAGKLPAELKFAAANVLLSSADATTKARAGKHLSLPATADSKPLPPLAELVKQTGDATRGQAVFAQVGTCAKCHKVKGAGKEVGPDLSEIGSKLSREAMYVSILDPSAGVSFNYETYTLLLEEGTIVSGILVSQTDDEVQIKTAEAIVRKFPRDEIAGMKKQTVSLMPQDLQKALTALNLVDVVEYLTTLKKP